MGEIVFYMCCCVLVFGLSLGYIIGRIGKLGCKHNWVLFKSTTIDKFRNGQIVQVGYVKFYECEHCKKMRKETVEL